MPEDTTARSAYVHMALRTAAVYTAERRVRRVGGPPAYVDIPGVYEVDPNFPDTEQTSGELALLGIVARLAEQDVTIRQLKRKIESLEDVIERGEVEEVEDLCGVDEGSADERSEMEEVWEEESAEATPSSSEAGTPSPPASGTQKRANRSRNNRPGHNGERGYRSHEGSPDSDAENSDQDPSLWVERKTKRVEELKAAKTLSAFDGQAGPSHSNNGEGSSSHTGGSVSLHAIASQEE